MSFTVFFYITFSAIFRSKFNLWTDEGVDNKTSLFRRGLKKASNPCPIEIFRNTIVTLLELAQLLWRSCKIYCIFTISHCVAAGKIAHIRIDHINFCERLSPERKFHPHIGFNEPHVSSPYPYIFVNRKNPSFIGTAYEQTFMSWNFL